MRANGPDAAIERRARRHRPAARHRRPGRARRRRTMSSHAEGAFGAAALRDRSQPLLGPETAVVTAHERRALVVLLQARRAATRAAGSRASIPAARIWDGDRAGARHRLRRLSGGRGRSSPGVDPSTSRATASRSASPTASKTDARRAPVAGADRGRASRRRSAPTSATRSGSSSGATCPSTRSAR